MKEHEFNKYLKKSKLLPVEPQELNPDFCCVAVIPACDELETIDRTFKSLEIPANTAVLVVINHPADGSSQVKNSSRELLQKFRDGEFSCRNLFWIYAPDLAGGVGEARKIGMDAVVASQSAATAEQTIIASLDADTIAEADYFPAVIAEFKRDSKIAALAIPFVHQAGATPAEERAIREYEAYLTRHVAKLSEANSPYAFQTVGSAFAVRLSSYIRAGGMRIRKGGEDFYFLQAVAKIGVVATGRKVLVHPSSRPSERVPFGTGPAIKKLISGGELDEISDGAFAGLKSLLAISAASGNLDNAEDFLDKLDPDSSLFLRQEGFAEAWEKILANTPKNDQSRRNAFNLWFDGLKSLRYLHWLDRR
ncbi:MAG: hypothetical protein LBM70_00345 [Victivallales bacterium]|nr:hypothetical protein [Victivallales bacterium]